MKIAIAQLNPTIGDLQGNSAQILAAAQQAQAIGARLMITPELSICGYPPRDLLLKPSFVDRMASTVAELAQQLPPGLAVLVGTVTPNPNAIVGGKPLFNSVALLDHNSIQQVFHKRLLPTYDVFDEDRYFEPSRQASHFHLEGWHLGVTICEDLWNDEEFWGKRNYLDNPIADLANLQVDFTINLSASPYSVGKQTIREKMLQHAAQRFKQSILYVNQVGGNDDLIFDGGSFLVNASGHIITRSPLFESDLQGVECERSDREIAWKNFPAAAISDAQGDGDRQRRSGRTSVRLGDVDQLGDADRVNEEVWNALVLGVRDYARKCGFKQAVLGLSGGIDSALVAAIAATALGAENVLGVLMPSPYSSDHSVQDALDLAERLGIKTEKIAIAPMMQSFNTALAPLFAGTEFGVAEENLQSRIRGTLLMGIANKFGYLLISTGNKSEIAVGYCTLYGDMNGGLAAIADVPKTRVYSLCRWLNSQSIGSIAPSDPSNPIHPSSRRTDVPPERLYPSPSPIQSPIPENILTKPPSAELKPGQLDRDSLPDYDILDDILHRIIEQHQSCETIAAAGHDPQIVAQITRLVKIAEFKRKQAPPGLKITDRAFGTGWRMPIAQKWQG